VFVDDAVIWQRTGSETSLLSMLRAAESGVPHDIGAAYATLASRTGNLLDAMEAGRLALAPDERDAALFFVRNARRVRALPDNLSEEALRDAIVATFVLRQAQDDNRQAQPVDESVLRQAQPFDKLVLRQAQDDNRQAGVLRQAQPFDCAPAARAQDDKATARAQDDNGEGDKIEVAQPIEPEDRSGVPGWQRHFSASALNLYAECERKWFYRYACAAVEDPGSSASAYGTAFHSALEDFHEQFPRPNVEDESAMRHLVRDYVTWAFERQRDGFATRVEFELQVRRAQRTAQRYVDWLLAQAAQAPFEVIGREVAAEIDLDGYAFVGYIDRLDRDERTGDVGVVDYKTGSIAANAAEYAEKVRRFRDFQLPFYYWARTIAGDDVAKLVLIPLKDALLDVRPVVLEVTKTIGIDDLTRSRKRMVELSAILTSGKLQHFATTQNPTACTYCAYATSCAEKPPAEAQRFGS
jgi:CRISPR/Cas system-associated exonuclease Cas4 (RecB family)